MNKNVTSKKVVRFERPRDKSSRVSVTDNGTPTCSNPMNMEFASQRSSHIGRQDKGTLSLKKGCQKHSNEQDDNVLTFQISNNKNTKDKRHNHVLQPRQSSASNTYSKPASGLFVDTSQKPDDTVTITPAFGQHYENQALRDFHGTDHFPVQVSEESDVLSDRILSGISGLEIHPSEQPLPFSNDQWRPAESSANYYHVALSLSHPSFNSDRVADVYEYDPDTVHLGSEDAAYLQRMLDISADPPKHREYACKRRRVTSFRTWTSVEFQDFIRLSDAGFFYSGVSDQVQCFACGVRVENWGPSDEPIFIHFRESPDCVYLRVYLGNELYQEYKSNLSGQVQGRTGYISQSSAGIPRQEEEEEWLTDGAVGGGPPSVLRQHTSPQPDSIFSSTELAARGIRMPQYASLRTRRSTFSKWPLGLSQTPDDLAAAGFYYTGLDDVVRCYACDVGLQHWIESDDPWIEHARWFQECPHLLRVKGSDFIQMVQAQLSTNDEFDLDEFDSGETRDIPNIQQASGDYVDVAEANKVCPPVSESLENSLINRGYTKQAIFKALEICIITRRPRTSRSLIEIIESRKTENKNQHHKVTSEIERLRADTLRLQKMVNCILCSENQSNMLFLPCAHHCMCAGCAFDAKICPLCGSEIREALKTFQV